MLGIVHNVCLCPNKAVLHGGMGRGFLANLCMLSAAPSVAIAVVWATREQFCLDDYEMCAL